MTITTMRAITGTHVSGALPVVPTAPRAQKTRVAPFAPWSANSDNYTEMSARRYRHT
jgi:hypothetical protein